MKSQNNAATRNTTAPKLTLRTAVGTSILLLWVATPAFSQQGAAAGQWSYYAGDIGSTKYAPLDQINEDNVRRLRIAWRRPAVDQSILDRAPDLSYTRNLIATPLMVDGIGYTSNAVGLAEAFDPGTGETVWVQEPMDPGPQAYRGAETRGVAYWTDGRDQRILVQRGQVSDRPQRAVWAAVSRFRRGRSGRSCGRAR